MRRTDGKARIRGTGGEAAGVVGGPGTLDDSAGGNPTDASASGGHAGSRRVGDSRRGGRRCGRCRNRKGGRAGRRRGRRRAGARAEARAPDDARFSSSRALSRARQRLWSTWTATGGSTSFPPGVTSPASTCSYPPATGPPRVVFADPVQYDDSIGIFTQQGDGGRRSRSGRNSGRRHGGFLRRDVVVMLSGGGTGYSFPPRLMQALSQKLDDLVLADFDADGYGDIAVPVDETGVSHGFYWGTGKDTFAARTNEKVCSLGTATAVIDANEDGRPDLVVVFVTAGAPRSSSIKGDGRSRPGVSCRAPPRAPRWRRVISTTTAT